MTGLSDRLPDVVVIGVGNPFRRDDGVGPAVAERLRAQRLPGVRLAVSDGDTAALIDLWHGARLAVVVDALRVEPATPGKIHRFSVFEPSRSCRRPPAPSIPHAAGSSTPHAAGSSTPHAAGSSTPHAAGSSIPRSGRMDFGEAVELARVLDRLPDRLVLFAVEAGDVGFGPGLTPAVAAAAGRVAVKIISEVALAVPA